MNFRHRKRKKCSDSFSSKFNTSNTLTSCGTLKESPNQVISFNDQKDGHAQINNLTFVFKMVDGVYGLS